MKEAKDLITKAKLKIVPIDDMALAAEASVKLVEIVQYAKKFNLDVSFSPKATKDSKC